MNKLLLTTLLAIIVLPTLAMTKGDALLVPDDSPQQPDSASTKKEKTIYVHGIVADSFTKAAIPDVKVTLMREDSTVVDTTSVWSSYSYSTGIGRSAGTTRWIFELPRKPQRYILMFEHPNYETAYADLDMKQVSRRRQDIEGPRVYLKKAAHAAHFEGGELDEVVVKATKVKMVWRGDTLVFNADAFNVPEGSMLDGLIKQLPGVELNDDGEIFVNGKKIDNLTLNGADFFKGKNKVMLENLPYFTVKSVEVYKKQTEENRYLGITDEDKKEYTMDVILKREYSIGGSANIEAGYGTDNRYKAKGFGLRFSDRTRAVLFGGMNNINETMQYVSENSSYDDKTSLSGDNHFKQLGAQFVYQAPEEKLTNSTEVGATWRNDLTENRSNSETYLNGASTFGQSESTARSRIGSFELSNTLRATGKVHLYTSMDLRYNRNRNTSDGWNVSTADALLTDSINHSLYRSNTRGDQLSGDVYAYVAYRLPTGDAFYLTAQASGSRYNNPETMSLNDYTYYKLGTRDTRDRLTKNPNDNYNLSTELSYNYQITPDLRIAPSLGIGQRRSHSDQHEFLRDSLDYLFDAANSYEQSTRTLDRRANLTLSYNKDFAKSFFGIYGNFSANFQRQRMSYSAAPLSTDFTRQYTLLVPNLYFYFYSKDFRRQFNTQYYMYPTTPSVTDLIDRPITTDPLNIFLGNPNLKKSIQHRWSADCRLRNDSIDQTITLGTYFTTTHNARTQGYTLDMTTGARTYRPENIAHGNWNLGSSFSWSRALGRQKLFHVDNALSLSYNKSTALAIAEGSTAGELSRVGTLQLTYKPALRYQKNDLTLSAKADLSYRNIHRNIRLGQQPTDIWDIAYGLSGSYKLPWDLTIDTELTMHSRRGYNDATLNDNRLYWDASLTKSFHQGRWLVKLRGYDLLGQVSNLRYDVNAQGRTETWTNAMRRYALLTISYRFTQQPKKQDK